MQTSVRDTIKIIVISRKCSIFTFHNNTFKCPPFVEVLRLLLDCVVNDRWYRHSHSVHAKVIIVSSCT